MSLTYTCNEHVLQEMVNVIIAEVDPEQIILFGSRARGEARPDSDVDLLIIEREPFGKKRSRRKEAVRLWRALAHFRIPKDILVYSHEEVEKWKGSINHAVARALREGRVLFGRA